MPKIRWRFSESNVLDVVYQVSSDVNAFIVEKTALYLLDELNKDPSGSKYIDVEFLTKLLGIEPYVDKEEE